MTITPRTAALQLVAAAAAVAVMAAVAGAQQPLVVRLLAYAAAAAFAAWGVAWVVDGSEQGRARRAAEIRHAQILQAVDIVITSRSEADYYAKTIRPADVCRVAAERHGLDVDEQEAGEILARRIRYRGYPVPAHLQQYIGDGHK